jgi:hypothetical protein
MLYFWLNKTPPKWDPPLSVQEGFDISFLKYLLSPPFEHNRISIDKTLWKHIKHEVLKLVVVRSFCFGLLLTPPLAWIAKNGIIRALEVSSSPLVINKWVKIIPKAKFVLLWAYFLPQRRSPFALNSPPRDGEKRGVAAKDELRSGSLCLRRRLQFPFNIPMTWFEIDLKTH